MALFSSGAYSPALHQSSQNLIEFRAGKMSMRDRNMVHPDKRKGLLYIHQSDDMLMHFCWKDRTTGNVEDDLIIFPDDTEFVPVKECTSGRVFLLKFKSSSRKLFFWMQEPKTDKDDEYCRKVNDVLNNPPAPGSARTMGAGRGSAAGSGNISDQISAVNQALGLGANSNELNALAGMDQQQLMQFLNLIGTGHLDSAGLMSGAGLDGAGQMGIQTPAITQTPSLATPSISRSRPVATPSDTTAATEGSAGANATPATATSANPAIQLSDLQNILAGMNIPQASRDPPVALEEALSTSNVAEVAHQEENAERLAQHLPTEAPIVRNADEVWRTVRSPQFRQAAGVFGSAFQTGQLGPLVRQFGLSESSVDAADRGDIQSFAELLEQTEQASASASGESTNSNSKETEKKDDKEEKAADAKDKTDEEMDLD